MSSITSVLPSEFCHRAAHDARQSFIVAAPMANDEVIK
jgi:hypothetical protein